MTINSLSVALSGLKAAQKAMDVTSNNIANASTPGFSRKILPQSQALTLTGPVGVQLEEIIRSVDMSLVRDLMRQSSTTSSFETREKFLAQIQAFHGPSDAGLAISSQISDLKGAFQQLADSPDDPLKLANTLSEAQFTAQKFNEFSDLITRLRNDAQNEIAGMSAQVNGLLETFSSVNEAIRAEIVAGRSPAPLQDQRDQIVREITDMIDVTFFIDNEGSMVLQTRRGDVLADYQTRPLVFNSSTLGPSSYYPASAAGLYIESETTGVNLTEMEIGGRLGALLELRDETLPQYGAQLDELAQKLASRFDNVGLRLFTDSDGTVPDDVADPLTPDYTGFAGRIQVNDNIIGDPSLLRRGTTGDTVLDGSNEVIRRVVDFTFGAYLMQRATGDTDISGGDIFTATGMTASTQVIGDRNLTLLGTLDSDPDIVAGSTFNIDIGGGPQLITINPGDTANDLVNSINAALGGPVASLNGSGYLVLNATDDVEITDGTLGAAGIDALGLSFGITPATNPSFSIQVGTATPITITIGPADTAADLLADLNAVAGITASLTVDGYLQITPDNGGDIQITDLSGNPAYAFLGLSIENVAHSSFRQDNISPSGQLSSGLVSIQTLEEYARASVSFQSEQHYSAKTRYTNELSFKDTLERRLQDESGVDIDAEVSKLIELQTAYTAAARMISISERLFDDLLSSFS